MFLPDVNVLLALAFDAHEHHPLAVQWLSSVADGEAIVCRVAQSGFLRLASNPALFGDEALTLSEAWMCYDRLLEDTRFAFSLEPLGLDHYWRRLTLGSTYSTKVWTDRYLAAFAIVGGLRVVTFDGAFASIPDLESLVLGA
ncbi:MAG TPA: TA system VapC family ribonuclease toxin [Spirochaetia bacterium]|nr:TA system VapC family ribonuclease toxin [Spirochaetia bacterium]